MLDSDKKENKLLNFIKGSTILILSNICLKAINFFLLPLYTKNLTPAMMGISDAVTTLSGIILPLLTMGLDSAFSAFYFDKKDNDRAKKVFSTLTWTFVVLGIIPIILMLISKFISQILFNKNEYSYIIKFAFLSISFNLWYMPYVLELRLKNKMFLYGLSNVIVSLTMVVLNIIFVSILKLGEFSLVLSTLIVHIENLIILLFFVDSKPNIKLFDICLLKQMIKFALPLIPTTIMIWVLSLSDRYVLLYYYDEVEVGLYGIGLRFTNVLNVVISAISMAYTTFAFSSKDEVNSKKQYNYVYNIESILLLCIAFTIGLFGKEIIKLMTDISYTQSYLSLRDLMFSQIFYAMTSIVGYGIYFEKKSIYSLISVSSGAMLNLVLNFILIPKYGILAAAFTTLLGYMLNYFLTLYFSENLYPCDYGQNRVFVSILFFYVICCLVSESIIFIKIIIWAISIIIILLIYRDIILKIKDYVLKTIDFKFNIN